MLLLSAVVALAESPQNISRQLASGDEASIQKGVADIRAIMDAKPEEGISYLEKEGFKALLHARHYDDAAELALRGISAQAGQGGTVESLQRWRVSALLEGGRAAEGLAAAKGLFNVSSMETTDRAVLMVAEALNAARPDEPDLVDRFKAQQMAGAATRPADGASTRPGSVMASIHVDASPYAAALDKYDAERFVINAHEFEDRSAEGNLLLLADRAAEARENYQRMFRIAVDDHQRAAANAGIARSIKAEAGAIGPANRWVMSLGK